METLDDGRRGQATVTAASASSIGMTTATLGGSVNPDSSDTTYYFEYGRTGSFGSTDEDDRHRLGLDRHTGDARS